MTKHLVKSYNCKFSRSPSLGTITVSFMMFEKGLLEEVVDVRTLAELKAAVDRVHAAAATLTTGSYRTDQRLVRGERAISGYRKLSYASLTRECDRDTGPPELVTEPMYPDAAPLPAVPETETVQLEDGPVEQAVLPGVPAADPPLTHYQRVLMARRSANLPPPSDGLFGA